MTVLLHTTHPARTLTALVDQPPHDSAFEAWTFDDRASRQKAEADLAERGIKARIHSAYKPIVTFFREDVAPGYHSVDIAYPVHPNAVHNRFLLESYPLAAMLAPIVPTFHPGHSETDYVVTLGYADGTKTFRVFAPNWTHPDASGETQLSPTGWVRHEGGGHRLETDYETLFHTALQTVRTHVWPANEPYFQELTLSVTLPAADEPLPHDDEVLSLREAMHEDLYFSLLEYFGALSGRPAGDRHLQPGQIVPLITSGAPGISIRLSPLSTQDRAGTPQILETAQEPPSVAQIRQELHQIGGQAFTAATRSGRVVDARYVSGTGAPVMISAGQHPNETTPIVGALRAAHRLRAEGACFTISPLENPDGYALHGRLVQDNPAHMHHAARYTAFGDDLEYRENPDALYEQGIRRQAETLTNAQLHVNLHGYPSHEWTRPMSGYVPKGFDVDRAEGVFPCPAPSCGLARYGPRAD